MQANQSNWLTVTSAIGEVDVLDGPEGRECASPRTQVEEG